MEREHVFCSEPGPRVRLRLYLDAEQNVTFVLIDLELIGRVKLGENLVPPSVKWVAGNARLMASNNWVISGKNTRSGQPLLGSDPHLEINRLPAVWQEIILKQFLGLSGITFWPSGQKWLQDAIWMHFGPAQGSALVPKSVEVPWKSNQKLSPKNDVEKM